MIVLICSHKTNGEAVNARNLAKFLRTRGLTVFERTLHGVPDVILAKDYESVVQAYCRYPSVPIVYLVPGSEHAVTLNESATDLMKRDPATLVDLVPEEVLANRLATRIVPNSELSGRLFRFIYPAFVEKLTRPINTSLVSTNPYPSLRHCHYDVGFVVSDCNRGVKGAALARTILAHCALSTLSKVVVGDHCEGLPRMRYDDLLRFLPHVKVIIIPSLFDASPNLVVEAVSCGTMVITTADVGNTDLLPTDWIVTNRLNIDEWASRILHCIAHPVQAVLPTLNDDLLYLIDSCVKK